MIIMRALLKLNIFFLYSNIYIDEGLFISDTAAVALSVNDAFQNFKPSGKEALVLECVL